MLRQLEEWMNMKSLMRLAHLPHCHDHRTCIDEIRRCSESQVPSRREFRGSVGPPIKEVFWQLANAPNATKSFMTTTSVTNHCHARDIGYQQSALLSLGCMTLHPRIP